ncbi:MAG: hypothetical protein K6E54_00505, partial [Bacteroidaceae bacterium]|nr:hypothetical protein [Bacteroidaceae bacterium]
MKTSKIIVCYIIGMLLALPMMNAQDIMSNGKKTQFRISTQNTLENANDVVLYAFNSLQSGSSSELKQTVYSFHAAANLVFDATTDSVLESTPSGILYGDGKYYVFVSEYVGYDMNTYEYIYDNYINVYDAYSLKFIEKIVPEKFYTPMSWGDGAYDPSTKNIYYFAWNDDYAKELFAFNVETKEIKGCCIPKQALSGVAYSKDGNLYGFNAWDAMAVYRLNISDGSETKVGGENSKIQNAYLSSLAIDDRTKTLYAVRQHSDMSTHLYSISLEDGTNTLLADFPANEHFHGLFLPYTAEKAPAPVENIDFILSGDLDGTLSFSVPTKTHDNAESLTGTLVAYLEMDGEVIERNVTPGEKFKETFTFTNGSHKFRIQVGNAAGKSQERRFNYFIGVDLPGAPLNPSFTLGDDERTVSLSWEAPNTTQSGAVLDDAGAVTYRVIRMPQNVVVADNISQTTFTEVLSDERAHYYYLIYSMSGTQTGDSVITETKTTGVYFVPPFKETFDDEASLDHFTCEGGWHYETVFSTHSVAHTAGLSEKFITPLVRFAEGKSYKLYFGAMGGSDVKVMLSKDKDFVNGVLVLGTYETPSVSYSLGGTLTDQMVVCSDIIDMEDAGDYYIAFETSGESFIDNLEVVVDADKDAPDMVEDFVVSAGAYGALNSSVTFSAPKQTCSGNTLSNISKIVVYGDVYETEVLKTFENPIPGEMLEADFTDLSTGFYTYYVRAYNEYGQGKLAKATVYVGLDAPASPSGLAITTADGGYAKIAWQKSETFGINGGYVDADKVLYKVYRKNEDTHEWDSLAILNDTYSYVDKNYSMPSGCQQAHVTYAVSAVNEKGSSPLVSAGFTMGSPYSLPYLESFEYATLMTYPWTLTSADGVYYDEYTSWIVFGRTGLARPVD